MQSSDNTNDPDFNIAQYMQQILDASDCDIFKLFILWLIFVRILQIILKYVNMSRYIHAHSKFGTVLKSPMFKISMSLTCLGSQSLLVAALNNPGL